MKTLLLIAMVAVFTGCATHKHSGACCTAGAECCKGGEAACCKGK